MQIYIFDKFSNYNIRVGSTFRYLKLNFRIRYTMFQHSTEKVSSLKNHSCFLQLKAYAFLALGLLA